MALSTSFISSLSDELTESSAGFVLRFDPAPPSDVEARFRAAVQVLVPERFSTRWMPVGDCDGVLVLTPQRGPVYDPFVVRKICDFAAEAFRSAEPPCGVCITPIMRIAEVGELEDRLQSLEEMLETILHRRLSVNFQPIIRFGMQWPYGYEALIRLPQGGNVKRPGMLFRAADNARLVAWFDLACQEAIFEEAARQELRSHLFINMDAEGLAELQTAQESLADRAEARGLPPNRIVLEITERQAVDDFPRLQDYIEGLRARGFKIAVDDAGAGYSSLHAIAQLRPDIVKIDRSLVRGIDRHGSRRSLFNTLAEHALHIGAQVLAEGVETEDELATIIDMGVPLVQGYLLGRPNERMLGLRREMRDFISVQMSRRRKRMLGTARTVEDILMPGYTVTPDTTVDTVAKKLWRTGDLESIVVLEEDTAVGQVNRQTVRPPSADAPDERPVTEVMDRQLFRLEVTTPILVAARQATSREYGRFGDDMIVERDGRFCGVLSPRSLLDSVTTLQINKGKYAHPMTGLPGRVTAEERCRELAASGMPFHALHMELDWFQVYNDLHGVPQGDAVLQRTAEMLTSLMEEHAPEALLAQLGGKGFLLIGPMPKPSAIAARVVAGFDSLLPNFHSSEDLLRGYQTGHGTSAQPVQYPLLRMTVVAVQELGAQDARLQDILKQTAPVHRNLRELPGTRAKLIPTPAVKAA